ncbi:MAG TPA: hypothetical protein VE995_04365, partial [Gaiellaceae bacterium]|nr:hypothetical protein [Gaiellaceae bacterium]
WLLPASGACVAPRDALLVEASAPAGIERVRFLLDGRRLARGKRGPVQLWSARLGRLAKGRHVLEAVAVTRGGHTVSSRLRVHTCSSRPRSG